MGNTETVGLESDYDFLKEFYSINFNETGTTIRVIAFATRHGDIVAKYSDRLGLEAEYVEALIAMVIDNSSSNEELEAKIMIKNCELNENKMI